MNYNLLKPFDLEAVNRGEEFVFVENEEMKPRKFIAGPDAKGHVVVENEHGCFHKCEPVYYFMKPLAWVEDKPVYKGDVLYYTDTDGKGVVYGINSHGNPLLKSDEYGCVYQPVGKLSWNKPKTKHGGWGVIRVGKVSKTREDAEEILKQHAGTNPLSDLIAGECRVVRIEWEE